MMMEMVMGMLNSISACAATVGYISNDEDCDDSNSDINPDTGCGSSCQDTKVSLPMARTLSILTVQ